MYTGTGVVDLSNFVQLCAFPIIVAHLGAGFAWQLECICAALFDTFRIRFDKSAALRQVSNGLERYLEP